jgi:4'-phosphopantetheinyl transferase
VSLLGADMMLALREGTVHLWQAPLDMDPSELAGLGRCLSGAERARAEGFRFERDRARWTASRAWLRLLLARYLGAQPADLEFVDSGRGKPRLVEALGRGLRFNLSHSEGTAVYAVAQGCEVGVDLEFVDSDFPVEEMARRFFSTNEQEEVAALPADLWVRGYLACWTRREAYLKGVGLGLSATAHPQAPVSGWSVHGFDAGCDYVAAVAVAGFARVPHAATPLHKSLT